MSWYGGAPLKDAFNIIGECSKKKGKIKIEIIREILNLIN